MTTTSGPRAWQAQAACRGMHEIFFPRISRSEKVYAVAVLQAQLICQRCPVRTHCHRAAVEHGEHHGIWGGTDFTQPWRPRKSSAA